MSNGIQNPHCLKEATKVINEYAFSDSTEWIYTEHANDRAEQRLICKDWIEKTLTEGNVVELREHTLKNGKVQYRYKVSFVNNFGKTEVITVIPSPYKLVIVTEW